jgi:hypothetical protein
MKPNLLALVLVCAAVAGCSRTTTSVNTPPDVNNSGPSQIMGSTITNTAPISQPGVGTSGPSEIGSGMTTLPPGARPR